MTSKVFLRKDVDDIASMASNREPKQALNLWIGFRELDAACRAVVIHHPLD